VSLAGTQTHYTLKRTLMQGEMRSQEMEGPLTARAHAKDKKRLT